MRDVLAFAGTGMVCGTVLIVAFLVLLALPKSKMRSVCLEAAKWVFMAGLCLLVISPLDFVPDVIPLAGWADDIGYVVCAISSMNSALKDRRERQLLDK